MSELLRFFKDMRDNGYGLAEIAAQLGTSAIAEPVAGFAAMYDPQHGADAIREGMTYQPRTQEAQEYSQSIGNAAKTAIKPAMPIIDTWKKGVDIAGQYSPVVGAGLRTVPTAIGIAMGAKPALQAGRQVSEGLGAMQGRMIANANAPRTLNTGYMGQHGVFAGINALTADKEALAKAQQMIAQGVDPEDVWQETGWGRGADGKWRFEIDDSGSSLNMMNFPEQSAASINTKLSELLKHPRVYQNYPESKNMSVLAKSESGSGTGTMMGGMDGLMIVRGSGDNARSTTLHELQHAIQNREGFAKGGSPSQFNKDIYSNPDESYRRLGGEVEARMVENRMDLTPQQRRDIYPFAVGRYGYEDIPRSEQLFPVGETGRFGRTQESMPKRPLTEFEQAHLLAQQRAALPVNQRGLDLPADNTAMDRARAMGWDTDVYHGSAFDIENIDTSRSPFYTTEGGAPHEIEFANNFANTKSEMGSPKVYPLLLKKGQITDTRKGIPEGLQNAAEDSYAPLNIGEKGLPTWGNVNSWARRAKANGEKGVLLDERPYLNSVAVLEPSMVRSRFAAFDPFNRDSSNLLAQSAKLAPTTALGAYMYNEKRKKSQGKQ